MTFILPISIEFLPNLIQDQLWVWSSDFSRRQGTSKIIGKISPSEENSPDLKELEPDKKTLKFPASEVEKHKSCGDSTKSKKKNFFFYTFAGLRPPSLKIRLR